MDDIKGETPASESEAPKPPAETEPRSVVPESETRGGAQAPDVTLPGQCADLPPGSLPGPYLAPQGDENRTPPPNAPSPVKPAVTVETPAGDREDC